MNEEQRKQLVAMTTVHREFEAAANARLACLVRAQTMIMAGTLTASQVARAIGVSEGSWYRWARDLELRELAADCVAEVDKVMRDMDAGADNTVADLQNAMDNVDGLKIEHALASIGVWRKS